MDILKVTLQNARRGKFVTSFCSKCKKYIWPPNNICHHCYSPVVIKDVTQNGILLSKSVSHTVDKNGHFGLGEFDGVRVIGTIEESIRIGDRITICTVSEINGKIDLKFCIHM